MPWRNRGLLSALLLGLASCGVAPEEAVYLKEGETLGGSPNPVYNVGLEYCTSYGCSVRDAQFCVELLFDYGRSPPLCVPRDVCDRLRCAKQGYECRIFEGISQVGEVRCVKP